MMRMRKGSFTALILIIAIGSFSFVDVKGERYEAPLLKNILKHSYDFSRLKKENGMQIMSRFYNAHMRLPYNDIHIFITGG